MQSILSIAELTTSAQNVLFNEVATHFKECSCNYNIGVSLPLLSPVLQAKQSPMKQKSNASRAKAPTTITAIAQSGNSSEKNKTKQEVYTVLKHLSK